MEQTQHAIRKVEAPKEFEQKLTHNSVCQLFATLQLRSSHA